MSLKVVFRRAARYEFDEAAAWYEKRRENLGVEFVAEIDRCVKLAAEHPKQYMKVYKDVRRVLARRFPFGVYFQIEAHQIVILAVFHSSRNPLIWRSRV